jgi:hypothetical protein
VRASLNQHFPNQWIGCAGPCDFFLWRYVKDCVYQTPVTDINNLKDRIATVDVDTLQRTWMEFEHRLDIVHVTNSAHVKCM